MLRQYDSLLGSCRFISCKLFWDYDLFCKGEFFILLYDVKKYNDKKV